MKFYQMFCQQCGEKLFLGRQKDKLKIRDKKIVESITKFEKSHELSIEE